MKFIKILILIIIPVSLVSCKPEEIILHGAITGEVTNGLTGFPLNAAHVTLNNSTDTINTGSDGIYLIRGLVPGDYVIEASAEGYAPYPKDVTVIPAETKESVDFPLDPTSELMTSVDYLDFGLDSTQLSFTLQAVGSGDLRYGLVSSKEWITPDPLSGSLYGEPTTITVTIDKTHLPPVSSQEYILITTKSPQNSVSIKKMKVYMNGVMDQDTNYYNVVEIGTQTWMAENLRVGTRIIHTINQTANGITEKYWYDDNEKNYDTYGGLYQWNEMMNYKQPVNEETGNNQGICPVGWHIPTLKEWKIMIDTFGGQAVAGGKLKEQGTEHWTSPNSGATNESGFTGLPGGWLDRTPHDFHDVNFLGYWWSSEEDAFYNDDALAIWLEVDNNFIIISNRPKQQGFSVRCVKDQEKH